MNSLLQQIAEVIKANEFALSIVQEFGINTYPYDMNNIEYPEEPILLFEEGNVQVIIEPEFGNLFVTHLTPEEYNGLNNLLKGGE